MIIHCYVGLPGSGKTTLAMQDSLALGGLVLDDKFTMQDIVSAANRNVDYVYITDPSLVDPAARSKFERTLSMHLNDFGIIWMFFENDPEKAISNVKRRNDGRIVSESAIRHLYSKVYKIPEGTGTIPIWQP